jgi:hypothetical protein
MEHQQPDTQPGFYYVTVRRDKPSPEYRTLRGPFINDHAAALAAVDEAMRRAMDGDPRGCWYAYGTCRSEVDLGPGLFDELDAAAGRAAACRRCDPQDLCDCPERDSDARLFRPKRGSAPADELGGVVRVPVVARQEHLRIAPSASCSGSSLVFASCDAV